MNTSTPHSQLSRFKHPPPINLKNPRYSSFSRPDISRHAASVYGVYFQDNGNLVLYNRRYQPMVGWCPRRRGTFLVRHDEWIQNIVRQEWFYRSGSIVDFFGNRKILEEIHDHWAAGSPVLPSKLLPFDFSYTDHTEEKWRNETQPTGFRQRQKPPEWVNPLPCKGGRRAMPLPRSPKRPARDGILGGLVPLDLNDQSSPTTQCFDTVSILTGCSRNGASTAHKGYAKRASVDGVNLLQIPTHHHFREVDVVDIFSLSKVLIDLESWPESCLIRGALRNPADKDQVVYRRGMVFDDVPRNWVCFDVDGLPGTVTPEQVVEQVLPKEFQKAAFHYQYSNSHGFKPGTRIHLWFWMDKPVTSGEWVQWWHSHGKPALDPAVFRTIQPHITANPLLAGVADPMRGMKRSGLIGGGEYRSYPQFSLGPHPLPKHMQDTGAPSLSAQEPSSYRNIGFIGAFNRLVPVTEILERYEYIGVGDRYLHPFSESLIPDTVINSDTHAYAFSPRNPLYEQGMDRATGEVLNRNMDSFDCYRVLEHGGDEKEAVRDIRQMLKEEHPKNFEQASKELEQRSSWEGGEKVKDVPDQI